MPGMAALPPPGAPGERMVRMGGMTGCLCDGGVMGLSGGGGVRGAMLVPTALARGGGLGVMVVMGTEVDMLLLSARRKTPFSRVLLVRAGEGVVVWVAKDRPSFRES